MKINRNESLEIGGVKITDTPLQPLMYLKKYGKRLNIINIAYSTKKFNVYILYRNFFLDFYFE